MTTQAPPAIRRVVVAEDHAGVRMLVRQLIELEDGFHVVGEAGTGAEALEVVGREHPDALVLDLGLPVLDGEAVLARLHAEQPDVRVVVLTGQASALSWQRLADLGAAALIEKGVGAWGDALLAALEPQPA